MIKPLGDGCPAGVVRLRSAEELSVYIHALKNGYLMLLPETLAHLDQAIEPPFMPAGCCLSCLSLPTPSTSKTASLFTSLNRLDRIDGGRYEHGGRYRALSPSITVAQGTVLSLEEKFQGGNRQLTPAGQHHQPGTAGSDPRKGRPGRERAGD